jgi:hypothetical protein
MEVVTAVQSDTPREQRQKNQNQAANEIDQCERREFQQQFRNALQKHDLKTCYSEQTKTTTSNQIWDSHGSQQQTLNQIDEQNQRPAKIHATRPPTQQTFPWQLRERMRLLRAERDDAVRRELAVGTGPEVRRP